MDFLQDGVNGLVLNMIDIRKVGEGDLFSFVLFLIVFIKLVIKNRIEMEDSNLLEKRVQIRDVDVEEDGVFFEFLEDVEVLNFDMEEDFVKKKVKLIFDEEYVFF